MLRLGSIGKRRLIGRGIALYGCIFYDIGQLGLLVSRLYLFGTSTAFTLRKRSFGLDFGFNRFFYRSFSRFIFFLLTTPFLGVLSASA